MIEATLEVVEAGGDLSKEAMSEAMGLIMEGRCQEEEISRLLAALHRKGETVAEVAGAAAAMRRRMTPIRSSRTDTIDVVGTGGDGSGTFNISTSAALVTAAAGVPVAKHGNRAVTSRSGSSDVLAALGVNIEADIERVEACLEELGICFCFAPLYHRAMKHVAPVRQKLGTPTIFNILGPLVNPAGAPFQLLGVGRPGLRPLLAEAIAMLGTRRTLVVHGADGLDEVSLGERTAVSEVSGGTLREFQWTAVDFGLQPAGMETMLVEGPQQSAEVVLGILGGRTGPPRDIVVVNAAAALWTVGRSDSPIECARLAAEAIDSGAAKDLLAQLVRRTHA
ncbi:MAG: anthranilate phosphoribosyltransferase [Planctomycetes bacterium RBG_13_63_9]|nr:MAG: anthranilate phosphoribosyltransferase [Planctomycetes bacterium RBG_13_63_9]